MLTRGASHIAGGVEPGRKEVVQVDIAAEELDDGELGAAELGAAEGNEEMTLEDGKLFGAPGEANP